MTAKCSSSSKPYLIIRLHNYNMVSFGALLGACKPDLLMSFEIVFWKTAENPDSKWFQTDTMFLYSFMQPHCEKVGAELKLLLGMRTQLIAPDEREIVFIAGGSQATSTPEAVLSMGFDVVFKGEGEDLFPEMLQKFLTKSLVRGYFGKRSSRPDLSSFKGFSPMIGYLPPIEISRGCIFACTYCAVPGLYGRTLRHRSIDQISEIVEEYLVIKPHRKRIKFLSSNAFAYGSQDGLRPNPTALDQLLRAVASKGISEIKLGAFPAEIRPDFVTREVLEIVAPHIAGNTVVMGVQSASDRLLNKMNRGHTVQQAENAIKLLVEFGLKPHVDFIIGIPGETTSEQSELLDFMEDMVRCFRIRIHMHTFFPLPGSLWANKRAETVTPESRRRLRKLAEQGSLDGWWENQIAYSRR